MARTQKRSFGLLLIQVALALYLAITGLGMLGVSSSVKSIQATTAVYALFSGDVAKIVAIALGIVLLLCGVTLLVRMFADMGTAALVLKIISLIAWIVIAAIVDVCRFNDFGSVFSWLLDIGKNLLIIGGLLVIAD